MLGVLCESLEVDDKGVTDLGVDEVFIINVINLLGLDDFPLVEEFQGNILSGFFVLGHLDFTEATLAQNPTNLIVLQL